MDNKKLWFRAKRFGWGWTPITWQGWVSTVVFVAFLLSIINSAENWNKTLKEGVVELIIPLVVVTASFFSICFLRGEKPVWRWGRKV